LAHDMTATSAMERLCEVRDTISKVAHTAGRDPSAVTLVAVTKTFEAPAIIPVIGAGHRVFGENRVQEAKAKWPELRAVWPDIELHLIGPLQSNKAREAVALFDVIHTVDRPKIASVLAVEIARAGRSPRLMIQVNTGAEPQKAGVMPDEAVTFCRHCREELGLKIDGLMCIPPVEDEPGAHFARLAQLAHEAGLQGLSMGMSGDYELAIRHGATHVRVGSAIFGAR
jgi:pyridoxal phosphate enzyme (YggS family)